MKAWFIAGAGLMLMGGIAIAQTPAAPPPAAPQPPPAQTQGQPPPPPGARPAEDGMRGPYGGPMGRGMGGEFGRHGGEMGGWERHRMGGMMPPPPPPPPGAHFRLRREGSLIDVRCAENEPMKACVDAAAVLLDKAAAQR